jgi:hypothetical protein
MAEEMKFDEFKQFIAKEAEVFKENIMKKCEQIGKNCLDAGIFVNIKSEKQKEEVKE